MLLLSAVALVVALAALGVGGYAVYKVRQYRIVLDRIAAAKKTPPSPELIKLWTSERGRHPKGSPRWIAYTNRLRELGVIGPDGD